MDTKCRTGQVLVVTWLTVANALAGGTVLGPPRFPVPIPKRPVSGEKPRGAILSGSAGTELVTYSCLGGPTADRGYWTPTTADVERLENELPVFMSRQRTPSDYEPLYEYYRQYAGFTIHGKKYVCVNLFHASHLEGTLSLAQKDPDLFKKLSVAGPPEEYWRREPVTVEDGGAHYFSIQFEVATSTFSHLQFNGYA